MASSLKRESSRNFFHSFLLCNAKILSIKTLLEVTLISLSLREGLLFKISENPEQISLYCSAAEQKTSTSKLQNVDFPYLKLRPAINELSLPF